MLISETDKDGNQVWTAQEVADYLKLSPQTVKRMAARGEIPAKKIGRQWRFTKENIDAYINEDTTK